MSRHNGRPRTYRSHDEGDVKVTCCVCDRIMWATPIGGGRYALHKVKGHKCPGFFRGDHTPTHLSDRTPSNA